MSYVQFSSFQIGKMLNVSRQAVNQWIDKGYIKSYRTPGGHRRVKREDLIHFLKVWEIPIPDILLDEGTGNGTPANGPRIMLVDDDNDFLTLLEHGLKDKMPNARISRYSNGYDALVAIGAQTPDLLVLDLKMPEINGVEVCRRLKENKLTADLPIIVVSGYDTPEWRENLKSLKVEELLSKSMPLMEIATSITNFVRERAGASNAATS